MQKSITVYCSASTKIPKLYTNTAYSLGQMLARNHITLVYGGGTMGLMGAIARGVISENGNIVGIIPRFLIKKEGLFEHPNMESIVCETLSKRRFLMEKKGQGVLILPGGFGTLDELFAVLTLKSLHVYPHPIVLYNQNNYYNPLISLLNHMENTCFSTKSSMDVFHKLPPLVLWLKNFSAQ